ncbi:MAG: PD-(D/E)XK nuclease family protein, partial [Halanaerobiales bacterium]
LEREFLNLLFHNNEDINEDINVNNNNIGNDYNNDNSNNYSNNYKKYIVLPLAEVPGLQKPQSYYVEEKFKPQKYLDYLYNIEECSEGITQDEIKIKKAYGESNEVKEVLRELKRNHIPLDQAVVFFTVSEPYSQLFYDLSMLDDLPVTYGNGISIRNTSPGKLYFLLLKWINEGYSDRVLRDILLSGCFVSDSENMLYPAQIARVIRSAAIGRGRARYFEVLQRELRKYEPVESNISYRYVELKAVMDFMESIFEYLPAVDEDGLINASELIKGLAGIIDKHGSVSTEIDGEARKLIIDELQSSAAYLAELDLREVVLFLTDLIDGAGVGISSPKPGHLHIASYHRGLHISRQHNFVIGLDSGKFPGQGLEDPVLLDLERERLGRLPVKRDRQKDEYYQLAGLLTELKGNIYLSYPCFDTIESRENTPAAILLQVYRLLKGKAGADYTDLVKSLKSTAEFIPYQEDDLLDEAEYWLYSMLLENGISDKYGSEHTSEYINKFTSDYSLLLDIYSHIDQGLRALIGRKQGFNQYNGKILLNNSEIDPRENGRVMSVSKLEQIAKCPYCYCMKYILGIKPPDEVEYDPGRWLDPLMRGSLLHKIYELFYQEISSRGEKPSVRKHFNLLYQIAEEAIDQLRQELQPPSEIVFQIERDEILQSCQVFLASEEDNTGKAKPTYFELAFGFGKYDTENMDDTDEDRYQEDDIEAGPPVEIDLGNGKSIRLRGRIDRVDQIDENTYNIIDYKTGSTYNFYQHNYFLEGRQLQHALYALALEEIFTDDISVNLAGYIFPSLKGEGQRFMRPIQNDSGRREDVREIINILLDVISSGTMVMTNDDGECKFCDYRIICDPENMIPLIKKLRKDPENAEFDTIRRLADFE